MPEGGIAAIAASSATRSRASAATRPSRKRARRSLAGGDRAGESQRGGRVAEPPLRGGLGERQRLGDRRSATGEVGPCLGGDIARRGVSPKAELGGGEAGGVVGDRPRLVTRIGTRESLAEQLGRLLRPVLSPGEKRGAGGPLKGGVGGSGGTLLPQPARTSASTRAARLMAEPPRAEHARAPALRARHREAGWRAVLRAGARARARPAAPA